MRVKKRWAGLVLSLSLLAATATPTKAFDFGNFGSLVLDIVFGGGSIEDIFSLETLASIPGVSDVLEELDGIIPGISTGTILDILIDDEFNWEQIPDQILGDMGLPKLDEVEDFVLEDILAGRGQGEGPTDPDEVGTTGDVPEMRIDPGINPVITADLEALTLLTDSITDIGLSEPGQQATKARLSIGMDGAVSSGEIAQLSAEALERQITAAEDGAQTIHAQESTQETLKNGLSQVLGMSVSNATHHAHARQQDAINAQMSLINLQLNRESRDGTYLNGQSLQQLNTQMTRDHLRELAIANSTSLDSTIPYKTLHLMR